MKSKELEDGLEIIFDKEKTDLLKGETITKERKKEENKFYTVYSIIAYPNSETLKDFYYYLENDGDKDSFVKILQNQITDSEEDEKEKTQTSPGEKPFNGLSKLCFYTLIKLGFSEEALESLIKRKKRYNGILDILIGIDLEDYFTIEQLTKLIPKINDWNGNLCVKNILLDRIKSSRSKQFDQKMKSKNIEINQDKKTVSEKIASLGFDKKYNSLLSEIDDFLKDETHKSINSGMVNNLRVFMCDLSLDIARKISEAKNEEIPKLPKHSEIGNARSYVKHNLELTDKDNKFIDSFVEILHNEGGHSFLSEKEYFRLARNMAIEISLFVLSKYEKFNLKNR